MPASSITDLNAEVPLPGTALGSFETEEALNRPGNILTLSDQLRTAHSVQQALLPQSFLSLGKWSVSGCCSSAGPIGGDFYDIFHSSSGDTMLVVADVMGKGIPAALIASVTRTVIRMAANTAKGPAEAFVRVNELLYEDLSSADMFVTAQAAWLDPAARLLRIASAGHCPLILRDLNGNMQSVCPGGIPIGVAPKASYAECTIPMEDLRFALMYTDGVTEARNREGAFLGPYGLERFLRSATEESFTAESLKDLLQAHLRAFEAGSGQADDQTLLVLARQTP